MKKIILTGAALIFAGATVTVSAQYRRPLTTAEERKHQKIEDRKEAEIDKLIRNEETRARKAYDKALADYNAEIDKHTRAANEAMRRKEDDIERKRVENIKKGTSKIEYKYHEKHAKVTPPTAPAI